MRKQRASNSTLTVAVSLILVLGVPLVTGCAWRGALKSRLSGVLNGQSQEVEEGYLETDDTFGLGQAFIDSAEPTEMKASYLEKSDAIDEEEPYLDSVSPLALVDYTKVEYRQMSLQECIERALSNTEVIRDLGVNIVRSPGTTRTAYDPAAVYSDPRFGEEAALAQFDANFVSSTIFQKNDRPINNPFTGDINGLLRQDFMRHGFEINKLTASGTSFAVRSNLEYDANNNIGNRFPSTFQNILETEFRHPLLQGAGSLFNRIAGPSQEPGAFNGILIARVNTEIGLTRFEIGVRDLVSNVENAYWDLYYAFRELEAQIVARDKAFELYRETKVRNLGKLDVSGAREQYLRFENNIINSLEGRVVEGTQVDSGSSGGSFRALVGVRVAERRLRYLIGMPITDGKFILEPSESPTEADLAFDWDQSVHSALTSRPERRQQRWVIKQRELELTASKNLLQPRLDLVGTYRIRGLGDELIGGDSWNDFLNTRTGPAPLKPTSEQDLYSLDYQEWQLGAEMRMPFGFRAAHAGVRNAELRLQRARSIQKEQDRAMILGLSNAIAELRRAKSAVQLAKERLDAAEEYQKAAEEKRKIGQLNINVLLEAERRILEATLQYARAETEYAVAIKNVHVEKGSLLVYNNVFLQESDSDPMAYEQAEMRFQGRKRPMSYIMRDTTIGQPKEQAASQVAEWPLGVPVPSEAITPQAEPEVQDAPEAEVQSELIPNAPVDLQTDSTSPSPPIPVVQGNPSSEAKESDSDSEIPKTSVPVVQSSQIPIVPAKSPSKVGPTQPTIPVTKNNPIPIVPVDPQANVIPAATTIPVVQKEFVPIVPAGSQTEVETPADAKSGTTKVTPVPVTQSSAIPIVPTDSQLKGSSFTPVPVIQGTENPNTSSQKAPVPMNQTFVPIVPSR